MDDVAILAVINNPDLKIARADAGVAHAQAFAAGLLPDPQLALTRDFPRNPHDSAAGRDEARKADLNLLWQEWQVVAKARGLFVKLVDGERLQRLLEQNRALFDDRYRRTKQALDQGLLTRDAVTPNLTALQDVDKQLRDLERQRNADRHELNALLGLAPRAAVPLRDTIALPALDDARVQAALADLPRRRPDLLALQYGWHAQDERYRAAIAGQFPTFGVGFTRARDTGGVQTLGFGVTLSLPFFNGDRGNIAIEQATRHRLQREYQNRLNSATGDVDRILAEQRINLRQLGDVKRGVALLSAAASEAGRALRAGGIDALVYGNLQASLLGKQIEQVNLEQAILQQRVALLALIGGELPVQPD